MTRRDALVKVIDALHAEIAALKANDVTALARATSAKLSQIETLHALDAEPVNAELRALALEADRLNETCRIYVNLLAANVRRRLQHLAGDTGGAYRPKAVAAYA